MSKPVKKLKNERMKRAHTLIKDKRYTEARDILVTIDNPTARNWVKKIDHILLEEDDPFAELAPGVASPPESTTKLKRDVRITQENRPVNMDKAHGQPEMDWDKLHRSRVGQSSTARIWLSSILGILTVLAIIVLAVVYMTVENNKQQERDDVESAVSEFCNTYLGKSQSECQERTDVIMRDFDEARNCHASYYPDHGPEMEVCLDRIFGRMIGSP